MEAELFQQAVFKNDTAYSLACERHNSTNVSYLTSAFPSWEPEKFATVDKFLRKDGTFVDIGAWIGPLSFYANNKCKRVVAMEADPSSLKCLNAGKLLNHAENVDIIPMAIYSSSGSVMFGTNVHLGGATPGDSTTQINGKNGAHVQSITVDNMDQLGYFADACLVKVDIEGGEEYILKDLMQLCSSRDIPLYVSFHLTWWTTKTKDDAWEWCLEFFPDCTTRLDILHTNPFASVLFEHTRIPVYIISFNNPTYVDMMTRQLVNLVPRPDIHIVDNASSYPLMVALLKTLHDSGVAKVHYLDSNYGHTVLSRLCLPDVYALTDPDLLFAPDMPANMLQHLYGITLSHNVRRAGLALDLSDSHRFKTFGKGYCQGQQIYEWEQQHFWDRRMPDRKYELYDANIDTTFHVVNTSVLNDACVRIAGSFICKHLPWYKDPEIHVPEDERRFYQTNQICSSTGFAEQASAV